jgi:hypothetical protein
MGELFLGDFRAIAGNLKFKTRQAIFEVKVSDSTRDESEDRQEHSLMTP